MTVLIGPALLAACDSANTATDNFRLQCRDFLAGGDTQVQSAASSSCAGCAVSDPEAAIDGDLETFATLTIGQVSMGGASVRGIAQEGVVFAEGRLAGTLISFPGERSQANVTIRTFLDGDQSDEVTSAEPVASQEGDALLVYSIKTTMPFDAVEVDFNRTGGSANTESAQVHELCTDFDV